MHRWKQTGFGRVYASGGFLCFDIFLAILENSKLSSGLFVLEYYEGTFSYQSWFSSYKPRFSPILFNHDINDCRTKLKVIWWCIHSCIPIVQHSLFTQYEITPLNNALEHKNYLQTFWFWKFCSEFAQKIKSRTIGAIMSYTHPHLKYTKSRFFQILNTKYNALFIPFDTTWNRFSIFVISANLVELFTSVNRAICSVQNYHRR